MNQSNPAAARRRFQLVPGDGEGEQLDRFLAGADPLLIASLQQEERDLRRRRLGWSLAVLLGLATVGLATALPFLWRSGLLRPSGELAGRVSPDTEKARLLIGQGSQLISEDRYGEALASFSLAARLAPGLPDAWIALGNCQMRNYQSDLAERAFLQALALEPASTGALRSLGNLYLRRGEERKAEDTWRRGGPDQQRGELDQQLARLYLLQGRFREAEVRLEPLLDGSPQDELLDRMTQAARSRRLDSGLRSFLEPEPAGLSSWADLGWRLFMEERYDEASAAFARALAEVPYDVNALSGLGWSLLSMHRVGEAKLYFERALRLDNDHARSLNGLAHCLKSEGRIAEAIAVWQGMARLYPGVNYGTPGLAWTYYELRDYRQAALHFARLVKRYPHDSRVVDALNVAVENLGPARPH
ncbi:MAG TPA: tetratricopeptide repeat protein [Thermoanaerobaculia bacterium]|jgi:Flp pilus assembly protein TadD